MGEKERKEEEKKKLVFRVWEEPVFRPPRVESGKLPFATGLESVEKLETEREAVFCSFRYREGRGMYEFLERFLFFFFFLSGSIPGRNFRNSKQWEKKGRGEMMDEGRERDGGKEGEVFPEQASETTKASEAETRIVRHRLAASSTEESTSG